MTVDRFLAITKPLRYMSYVMKETVWVMIITVWNGPFLFFFLPSIFTYNPAQSDIYHVRGNIPNAHFPDSAPRYLCRCNFSSPSHCLESHRQTRELISQVRHNHAMNMSGQNIQPPAVIRVQHRSSTVLIILVMTAFNITYLGGNYHCLCFLTNLCPFAGTLR